MNMILQNNNDPQSIFDTSITLICPYCGNNSHMSAVSIPRYEYLVRFRPDAVGIVYRCDSCNSPVFLRFEINRFDPGNNRVFFSSKYEEIVRVQQTFETEYLPDDIASDFKEALTCFSIGSYNAFAAMCRRTAQSVFTKLGAKGKDKVHNQLRELKETTGIDDDTFEVFEQVIISGHDGAHPHLPKLSHERAVVLLELMKDVLYQLFIRQAKIKQVVVLRKKAIEESNLPDEEVTD